MIAGIKIEGADDIARELYRMQTARVPRVARAAMVGVAAESRRVIRRSVDGATASSSIKTAAKKTVGARVMKRSDGMYGAKAGFGVAKPTKKQRKEMVARKQTSKKGVGIGSRNIHWFVLGTDPRHTGTRTWSVRRGGKIVGKRSKSTGKAVRYTGFIDPVLHGLIGHACLSSKERLLRGAHVRAQRQFKIENARSK